MKRKRKKSGHAPLGGSIWPPLGGSVWVTLPGSRWATPGGSASPTPVAQYGATADKKAVKRIKGRIRQILRPGNQAPWAEVQEELNRVIRGWANYFSYGTRAKAYRAVDRYVAERTRYFLGRRHQVPSRGARRYSAEQVFGALGVWSLQRRHGALPVHARV